MKEHLDLIEKTRAADFSTDAAGQALLVDFNHARRLAGIMRRRLASAAELFNSDDDDLPLLPDDLPANSTAVGNWLPGKNTYNAIRDEVFTSGGAGPLCDKLLDDDRVRADRDGFLDPSSGDVLESSASNLLAPTIAFVLKLIELSDAGADIQARLRDIASIVGKAAGLTLTMQELERRMDAEGGEVERRPHHSVSVTADAEGKKIPVSTPLKSLLSDGIRLDEFVAERNRQSNRSAPEGTGSEIAPAGEVAALFHLFERLGFAVDFVLRDRLGGPHSQAELIEIVKQAVAATPLAALRPHVRLLFVAREPDSSHLGEDVSYFGYAAARLAVVPQEFWNELTKPVVVKEKLNAWLQLRAVDASQEAGPTWQRLGGIARWLAAGDTAVYRLIRAEARDRRWQTVPCSDGRGHVAWTVPSPFGHRFRVSMRYISRYEPLIRWAERLERPVEHEKAPHVEVFVRRVIGPVVRAGEDRPAELPAFVYSHPHSIRFSYLLPSAGARSLYNRISSVRSGFRGCETQVEYRIRDHQDPTLRLAVLLAELEPISGTHNNPGDLDDPPRTVEPIPTTDNRDLFDVQPLTVQNLNTRVRLFRHERMLQYDHLPFFYQFRLRVATVYDAELTEAPESLKATPRKAAEARPGVHRLRAARQRDLVDHHRRGRPNRHGTDLPLEKPRASFPRGTRSRSAAASAGTCRGERIFRSLEPRSGPHQRHSRRRTSGLSDGLSFLPRKASRGSG
ncbi:MAG: hypothetical protein QM775_34210 [Pirellulales bacterium]